MIRGIIPTILFVLRVLAIFIDPGQIVRQQFVPPGGGIRVQGKSMDYHIQ